MSGANDMQVAGSHYAAGYQHWDFVEEALCGLYMEGQITKYVSRWRKKNGIQDLKKALHFTEKLIELNYQPHRRLGLMLEDLGMDTTGLVQKFIMANELGNNESFVIRTVAAWRSAGDLGAVASHIRHMIEVYEPAMS